MDNNEDCAALLCDSLFPTPYALTTDEAGELFALMAASHQTDDPHAAAEWSAYIVLRGRTDTTANM